MEHTSSRRSIRIMRLRLLLASPRTLYCRQLKAALTRNPLVASVDEATTDDVLKAKLRADRFDFVVAHQDLVSDLTLLPADRFALVAEQPDHSLLRRALAHGVRGYVLERL